MKEFEMITAITESNKNAKDGLKTVRLVLESLSDLDLGKLINEFNEIVDLYENVEVCSHPPTYCYWSDEERTIKHCANCGAKNI